ncbi:MAG: YhdH/YhfP family quinone oxidoreductase [Bacteroidia bacterium]|nr:YhdH/YhfP family quinone oxidoreductase [Bacteroidia bacterium]
MQDMTFRAIRVLETREGFRREMVQRQLTDLPEGEVLIRVHYSSLNYKDALSATGHKGITRTYPHTPGIDAAGVVVESTHPDIKPGQKVIVTSYDLGMNTDGGFGEYIRVPASWVVGLPQSMTLFESMVLGTAGFTAALALYKLERNGLNPSDGPVVVTGASGGVGSLAVALLVKRGYEVAAVSGSPAAYDMLRQLGAHEILPREAVNDTTGRPILKSRWAGAIDTVGGNTLATLLKTSRREASIAVCGLVASPELPTTVYPFILNGVNLLGIDSATYPMPLRKQLWSLLANKWSLPQMHSLTTEVPLDQLDPYVEEMLRGNTQGRIVVDLTKKE